jgi:hypothetical protein
MDVLYYYAFWGGLILLAVVSVVIWVVNFIKRTNNIENRLEKLEKSGNKENGDIYSSPPDIQKIFVEGKDFAIERYAEVDIAFPFSEEEYCALGGNAIAMITASSEHQSELPLIKAYFQDVEGKEIIFTKIILNSDTDIFAGDKITKGKFANSEKSCFTNLSFWLVPVNLFRDDKGIIMVDFTGERKAFTIRRGPWRIDRRNQEYIKKQVQGAIKVIENQDDGVIAKILEREFINPRLSNKAEE